MDTSQNTYAGFWIRFVASFIDGLLYMAIVFPLLTFIYGFDYWASEALIQGPADLFFQTIFPVAAVLAFWHYKSATPGKMIVGIQIVDADSGGKPTTGQFVMRYLGYFVSMILAFLGYIWVAIDKRKQGFHDKIGRTVVVYTSGSGESVDDI